MGVQFDIRKLDPDHWFIYKHLRLSALKNDPQAFIGIHEEKLKVGDEAWKSQFNYEHTKILFVFEGNQAVGMAGYDINHYTKNAHVASIYYVYIHPDYRKQGLGTQLLTAVIEDIKTLHPQVIKLKLEVSSAQLGAIHMYEKAGFVRCGTYKMEIKYSEEYYDSILMEKFIR